MSEKTISAERTALFHSACDLIDEWQFESPTYDELVDRLREVVTLLADPTLTPHKREGRAAIAVSCIIGMLEHG